MPAADSDDDLGPGVLLGEAADGLSGVGQLVGRFDHGRDRSGLDERGDRARRPVACAFRTLPA